MLRLKVANPHAGPVVLEVPGFGAFMNGQTHEVTDEWAQRWMDAHTNVVTEFDEEGNVTGARTELRDFPAGFTLLPDEGEVQDEGDVS